MLCGIVDLKADVNTNTTVTGLEDCRSEQEENRILPKKRKRGHSLVITKTTSRKKSLDLSSAKTQRKRDTSSTAVGKARDISLTFTQSVSEYESN